MRLAVAVIVLLVFGALWLFDTGALLQLTQAEIREYPRAALGIAAAFALLIAVSGWRAKLRRVKSKPKSRAKPAARRIKRPEQGAGEI
jgi:protein-S-isoprenylcysteine O-methyltransferase Ste14